MFQAGEARDKVSHIFMFQNFPDHVLAFIKMTY